jgi:hypothetical protein
MVSIRKTDPIWVVSISDLLEDFDPDTISDYERTRDLKIIGVDIDSGTIKESGKKVDLFQVKPLMLEFQHELDALGMDSFVRIFRHHVIKIKGNKAIQHRSDKPVSMAIVEQLPVSIFAEMSSVIIDLGNGRDGDLLPFTQQGSWRQERMRLTFHLAKRAQTKDAKKTNSE